MKTEFKKFFSLLLASCLIVGSTVTVVNADENDATVNGSGLSVIPKEDNTRTKVGKSSRINFNLRVNREDDIFSIYQLAEMDWNDSLLEKKGSFEQIKWVEPVQKWLDNDATFAAHTDYSAFNTPAKLGAKGNDSREAVAIMKDMQDALAYDDAFKTAMADYLAVKKDGATCEVESYTGYTWNLAAVDEDGNATTIAYTGALSATKAEEVFQNEYRVSGLAFGLYMVDPANNSVGNTYGRVYQPLLVDVTPDQTGPSGNWYYGDQVTATLKYQRLQIDKYINGYGNKEDIVRYGEVVDFLIHAEVPRYPADATNKILYANDDMAPGFTLDVRTAYLEYRLEKETEWYHVDPETYTIAIASGAQVLYATDVNGNEKEFAYAYQKPAQVGTALYTIFYLKNGASTELGNYDVAQVSARSSILATYNSKVTAAEKVTGTAELRSYTKSIINAVFDYDKMMTSAGGQIDELRLSYKAVVNDNFFIGSDENTNKISFYYVKDSTGEIDHVDDIVRAWTYAANIVKVDGDTVDKSGNPLKDSKGADIAPTYLENAIFDLYRLTDIYASHDDLTAGDTDADYDKYSWLSNHDGATTVDEANTAAGENITITEKLSGVTGNVFIRAIKVNDGEGYACGDDEAVHYHFQVFSLFKTGIKSVGGAVDGPKGVTVNGLDPDEYLLVETAAPTSGSYNILSEAVWFEIIGYTGDQYATAGNSYKGFVGDDAENRVDGVYPIQVMNFQGLTLPSTGGMGTLIFTIVGITVMLTVMVIVTVLNRKKREII